MIAAPLVFAVEDFEVAFAEASALMEGHWQEIAKNKRLMSLNPDFEKYAKIKGALLVVTARCAGELVGYFMWIMLTHPHYRHVEVAEEDLHYLASEHRRGMAGYLFIKFACEQARSRGARLLVMREKIGHEHPAIMKRLGFVPTDITYTCATEAG